MMGLLNQNIPGGLDSNDLLMMMQQQKADPFLRPLPGTQLLGDGAMSAPSPMTAPQMQENMQQMQAPQMPGMSTISTDFADTQPGLPNLPDSFQGFGYGQFAPQIHRGNPVRQQLIQQLMGMMQQGPQNSGASGMTNPIMGANAPNAMRGF